LGLGSKDERRSLVHNEDKCKPKELPFMFPSRDLAIEGKADQLNPYYYYLNQFFRATIDPKIGDATALRYYAPNLLNRMAPDGEGFCIFDFIWNELRRAMNDPMKHLPYAPYRMYMIERVTNVCYPKDVSMSRSATSVIVPRGLPKVASVLARLVQLLAMMICPLHALLLHLPVGTVAP
jgi:hypothetical protein